MTLAEARKIEARAARFGYLKSQRRGVSDRHLEMRLAVHYAWLTHFEDRGMSRSEAGGAALEKVMQGIIPPPHKWEPVQ